MGNRKPQAKPARLKPEPAQQPSQTSLIQQASWLLPFAVFLVTRLFSADPYYLLGGDQVTFLQMARTFPAHHVYNQQLYLIHPPLFGWAIGLLHLALPLTMAGLVATLIFACLNFFAIRRWAIVEQLPAAAIFAGLLYVAISRPAVAYDYHVARVSILSCATTFALLSFRRLLLDPGRKTLLWAIGANAVCLMISDQALLLLPCQAVLLWGSGWRNQWKRLLGLAAASAVAAAIWPAVRLIEYMRHTDLPAGIDGTIEFTRNFPLMAVLQPNYLPFTNVHRGLFTQTSLSLASLKPSLLLGLPVDVLLLPRPLTILVVVLLAGAALAQSASRRRALQWLIISLLMLLPVGIGMNEWYGMGFLAPFALLMMDGVAACIGWSRRFIDRADSWFAAGLALASVVAVALWLGAPPPGDHSFLSPQGGTAFLFIRPELTRGSELARFFDGMPRDLGIMAPQGLSPEITYLTNKRVVALPFDPALLPQFIREYRISYLIAAGDYLTRYNNSVADRYTSHEVSRYLFAHPEQFRLVQSPKESYPAFYPPAQYFVFQVQPAVGSLRDPIGERTATSYSPFPSALSLNRLQ
jgi:hypothetical protein